ncbi:MAG: Holliday junction resolvase RuvX [Eggerthellaceae bacterium]|nr:Holliday junction resolvase RuvX [Eggerthellaceae bacterium]
MRVMALDIGDSRVGIAVSDPTGKIASPVAVLSTAEVMNHSATFLRIVDDWEPDLLVCGIPVSMNGEEGPQAKKIKQIARQIAKNCDISLRFVDERLSSVQAKRSMKATGMNERNMRGKVDMVAASIFLQAWLDENIDFEKDLG